MIHQPLGGTQGQATDIEIHAREILKTASSSTASWPTARARALEKIQNDMERDYFERPEAQEYGLIDQVMEASLTLVPEVDEGPEPFAGLLQEGRGGTLDYHQLTRSLHRDWFPRRRQGFMAEKKGSSSEKVLYCSFCGKSQHEVKADRGPVGVHLRRVHRAVQRHHPG